MMGTSGVKKYIFGSRGGLFICSAVICTFIIILAEPPLTAYANDFYESPDTAALTEQLFHESGADELYSAVPDEAADILGNFGFSGFQPGGVDEIEPDDLISGLGKAVRDRLEEPLYAFVRIIGIVIIAAALETVKGGGASDRALSLVTSLCAVSVVAPPVLELTLQLSDTIVNSGRFMLLYVPVISGLLIASGRAASGSMYCGVMVFVSSAVMQITSVFIVPILKCIMSLSVVSSAAEQVRLDGVTELFRRAARFVLTFCMSLFVAFLTMRSIVSVAADTLANKAVKFAVSSFVPLVGGALSDAYQTVASCVNVLKSGVGAAAIAAVFAIFVPVAIRCVLWQAVTAAGAAVCRIFGEERISSLLTSLSSVVSVMLAVLMCNMVIYIISTAIIMIVGG